MSEGQPMTPGTSALDAMSPVIGGDNEVFLMPDILASVRRSGEESVVGIVREVLVDGSCQVVLGSSGNGETVTALADEMVVVAPRKNDKIKIMAGLLRGSTGKLIGVDGSDGIVKVDDTLDVKILDLGRDMWVFMVRETFETIDLHLRFQEQHFPSSPRF